MKLITLNTWSGRVKSILDFFNNHQDIDIFLLQEVLHNGTEHTIFNENERAELFYEISELLPNHQGYFAPTEGGEWGLAIFIKKSIEVLKHGDYFVHGHKDAMIGKDARTLGRNIQFIKISLGGRILNVLNFHGLWSGNGKSDSPERISQSEKIAEFIKKLSGEIILAGDFNLLPDSKSLNYIEKELNLRNLIKEYNIKSTRTSYYTKEEKYADYIFCSSVIAVDDFSVMSEEVSDHSALLLVFK